MEREKAVELVKLARGTNAERDQIERQAGFAVPNEGGDQPALCMRTIAEALWCGILTDDPNCIAEGLCMLVDLEYELRMRDPKSTLPMRKYEPWK